MLNLSVASACNIQIVSNMMGHVKAVSDFFNIHPKRFSVLTDKIKEILPSSRHTKLIDVCRTRWIARIEGLDVFVEIFEGVVAALEEIKNNTERNWSSDSVRDASGLFHGTIAFEFIISLVTVSRILETTIPLTKQLQSPSIDVTRSKEAVNLLCAMLQRYRNEISELHKVWFAEAVELCEKVDAPPSKPRAARIQRNHPNTPSDSPSDYYRVILSLPFLYHLSSQVNSRFAEDNMNLLHVSYGLPSSLSQVDWSEKFSVSFHYIRKTCPSPAICKQSSKRGRVNGRCSVALLKAQLLIFYPRLTG